MYLKLFVCLLLIFSYCDQKPSSPDKAQKSSPAATDNAKQPKLDGGAKAPPLDESNDGDDYIDFSEGVSVEGKIAASLPAFNFKLIGGDGFVAKIEVYKEGKLLQKINTENEGNTLISKGMKTDSFFSTNQDMNFDEYNDIRLKMVSEVNNEIWKCWLYNPKTEKFEFNQEISKLQNLAVKAVTKTLKSTSYGSGGVTFITFYKIAEDGNLFVSGQIEESYIEKRGKYERIIKELKSGKIVETRREYVDKDKEIDW
ncbi:MAG: hypothetical protein JNN15_05315 [Blastocatellia bacterium]|nr:hypothetical protein [Blastocatellia bacterium]